MKNLLFALIALLFVSSCKDKKTDPVENKVTSIAIEPSSPAVAVGFTQQLTATVLPADAAKKEVTWSTGDETKATVDATGKVTGVAKGTAVITATAADGSGVAGTVTLTVNELAIALGDERFNVPLPAAGGTTALVNAPRSISSVRVAVKVNITAPANIAIKVNNRDFTQGQTVNFASPATFTFAAQGGTAKSYSINIPAYNATDNPYGIYMVKHLVEAARGLTASYLLKNNIDLPDKNAAGAVAATGIRDYASAGWLPLGASLNNKFSGTFDGGNFSVNNFYVKRTASAFVGLFGCLGEGGIIKNLGVNGVSGTAVSGSSDGSQYTGILAAYSEGTIDKCYVTGSVYSLAASGLRSYAGGLAGFNKEGTISNSYAAGSVSASASSDDSYAGGLAGYSYGGNISNSYATGSVFASASDHVSYVGGLVGKNTANSNDNGGNISNSYATGSVSSSNYDSYLGGLAGFLGRANASCTNCYRNSDAAIKRNNAEVTPRDANIDGITAKTKAEMQTNAFKDNLNGTSGAVWGRDESKNDKLPYINGVGVGK